MRTVVCLACVACLACAWSSRLLRRATCSRAVARSNGHGVLVRRIPFTRIVHVLRVNTAAADAPFAMLARALTPRHVIDVTCTTAQNTISASPRSRERRATASATRRRTARTRTSRVPRSARTHQPPPPPPPPRPLLLLPPCAVGPTAAGASTHWLAPSSCLMTRGTRAKTWTWPTHR